jgi:hypothetical protein
MSKDELTILVHLMELVLDNHGTVCSNLEDISLRLCLLEQQLVLTHALLSAPEGDAKREAGVQLADLANQAAVLSSEAALSDYVAQFETCQEHLQALLRDVKSSLDKLPPDD